VASLWQAFHLAGASDVVATLWDIPDIKLTSALVADFLGEYRRSSSAASSLRSVQLNAIKHLRDAGQSDHPVFWAGFVATSR
jgi:CHAT domain-containing protein